MEILKINHKDLIEKVEKFLKEGKVLIFPTDTVYGLLTDATNREAVEKVLKIKKRKKGKPIPIFVADLKMAKDLAEISQKEEEFLKKVWPGKVTVVLKRQKDCKLPPILFGNKNTLLSLRAVGWGCGSNKNTIGLRIPKYPLLNKLLKKTRIPLTASSANISGFPASTKIKQVLKQFKNQKYQPEVVIDAGNLKPAKPSTVVDLTGPRFKILRS